MLSLISTWKNFLAINKLIDCDDSNFTLKADTGENGNFLQTLGIFIYINWERLGHFPTEKAFEISVKVKFQCFPLKL